MKKPSCLIIKNDGIGDLILASGIIHELGILFDGNVDLITCTENREIAESISGIRKCLYVSRDGIVHQRHLLRLQFSFPIIPDSDRDVVAHLQNTHYDYAICLRRFIRSSSLILMGKVQARHKHCAWQFPTNISKKMATKLTRGWTHYNGDPRIISECDYFQQFVESIFYKKIDASPRLNALDNLKSSPKSQTVGIGIGPKLNHWPAGNWILLINSLTNSGWKVELFGGEDSRMIADQIKLQTDVCQDWVGKLTFKETVPHLKRLSAFIGTDTGFSHFASLIIPKCLLILGGGTFRRFLPWPKAENQHIIFHGLECFDCDWKCLHSQRYCISLITAANVFDYFNEMMDSSRKTLFKNTNPSDENYILAFQNWNKYIKAGFPEIEEGQISTQFELSGRKLKLPQDYKFPVELPFMAAGSNQSFDPPSSKLGFIALIAPAFFYLLLLTLRRLLGFRGVGGREKRQI